MQNEYATICHGDISFVVEKTAAVTPNFQLRGALSVLLGWLSLQFVK
ncbi:hypothetical protein BLL52_3484 [Rhodoferax antarcticus ANT.BR]|uniref:Uncharacterized protein n=1 Tax=Rhodoferax antarcticus ANT.BR TaxID=1111071 RepID=A0A1Q8YBS4_9BURK|nr:hypothetical protein BLL52_3484 [Rhodoferax antarcticus ANT.BR]